MPEARRRHWVGAFNSSYQDCINDDGDADECEGRAFRIANAAIETAEASAGFLFIDLQQLTPGKPFSGFAAGEFVDMLGRQIELKAKDIKDFLQNTLALIDEFQARNMPGLPIDEERHNKGKAAGWIVSAELGEVTDSAGKRVPVINMMAEWTRLGVDLIRDKIMTNFSPTVDLKNKVIRGGSLTNWAATQDENGVPLFAAVELSEGIFAIQPAASEPDHNKGASSMSEQDMAPEENLVPDSATQPPRPDPVQSPEREPAQGPETAELLEELFKKVPQVGQSRPDQLAELVQTLANQMAEKQVTRLVEEQQQQWEITELAARLTGGGLRGLPVSIPELTDFFLSLEPVQFEKAKSIFSKITNVGLVEFAEIGHGRRLRKRQLPHEYRQTLRETLAAGNTIEAYFATMPELGDPADYDLSEYKEQ